nr:MAG TPA: hypothetical protein [Caudoviricetes sp.]DAX98535.1 MAG TPA: hypothetical protein [Caudoviricetes sp.]
MLPTSQAVIVVYWHTSNMLYKRSSPSANCKQIYIEKYLTSN